MFIVIRQGVYWRQCGGIYSDLALAKEAALAFLRQEPDNHHSYVVLPFEADAVPKFKGVPEGGWVANAEIEQPEIAFWCRHGGRLDRKTAEEIITSDDGEDQSK